MTYKKPTKIDLYWLFLIVWWSLLGLADSQCCLQFNGNSCLSCPSGMHLYRSNCIYDLDGCLSYISGFDCSACRNNYKLTGGICLHQRFPLSISNNSTFTVFLQSTLKPDAILTKARNRLQTDQQLWINWYNQSLILNQTYLNKNSLIKNSINLMNSIVSKPKLQYIFKSQIQSVNGQLQLYRLTYQASLLSGFVDCLVIVEIVNGTDNYIELNIIKQKIIANHTGWAEVKPSSTNQTYILGRIAEVFVKSARESYIKGYWKVVDEGVNYTFFFMNSNEGVVSYIYIADPEQLPQSQITATMNETSTAINPPVITPSNSSSPISNKSEEIHSSSSQNNSTPSKPNSENTVIQLPLDISNLYSNPIFNAGYAVISQQYELQSSNVDRLFYTNTSSQLYGIYLNSNSIYYRFTFLINQASNQFQIISYAQSDIPFLNPIQNKPTNNQNYTNTNNQTIPKVQPKNKTKINANPSVNAVNCGKTTQQFIDITDNQNNDIFLPRINMLLHKVYSSLLSNSHIKSAKFSLSVDSNLINNITYQITYQTIQEKTYDFVVAIVNNQFQLIKSPLNPTTPSENATPSHNPTNSTKPANQSNAQSTENTVTNQTTTVQIEQNNTSGQIINTPTPTEEHPIIIDLPENKTSPQASHPTPTNSSAQPTHGNSTSNKTQLPSGSTNFTIVMIQIPAKNYTTDPKYKSLISILKSLYRIPSNSSVTEMLTWKDYNSEVRYQITFKMSYKNMFPNGTTAKITKYNLTVNTNSFVSVHNQTEQYLAELPNQHNNEHPTNAQNVLGKPPLPNSLPPNPSLPPTSQTNPLIPRYLKTLYNIFVIHSPPLKYLSIQSLKMQKLDKNYGQSGVSFKQIIKFANKSSTLCFEVQYQLFLLQSGQQQLMNLNNYTVINCSTISNTSLLNSSHAVFVNESNLTHQTKQQLLAMSNSTISITLYQKWHQYHKIRFSAINHGQREVMIDSQHSIILSLTTSPQILYSQSVTNNSLITAAFIQTLTEEMRKIFNLSPNSVTLESIFKRNDDHEVWCIDVYAQVQLQSIWIQNLYQLLKMQALYYQKEGLIRIMTAKALNVTSSSYGINMESVKTWKQLKVCSTLKNPLFNTLIFSLRSVYSSFFDHARILAVFQQHSNRSLTQQFNLTDGGIFQIGISKEFTPNYQSAYLLTVRYNSIQNSSVIQNLQSLPLTNLTINYCEQIYQDPLSLFPKCSLCFQGYQQQNGLCEPIIEGCVDYMENHCGKCKDGYILSQDTLKCSPFQDDNDIAMRNIINFYKWTGGE